MFNNAPKLQTKTASKKPEAPVVTVEGMEQLAALDFIIKGLTALKSTYEEDAKATMATYFVEKGCASKTRPVNFKGVEGKGEASCQLKDRASNSPVSDVEESLLKSFGIEVEEVEIVCDTWVINPAYCGNQVLLEQVGKTLSKMKGMPSDFIMKQDGSKKKIVPAGTLETIFSKEPEIVKQLLPLVGTLAISPKLKLEESEDITDAFKLVEGLAHLVPAAMEKAETEKKAKAAKSKAK